MSRARVRLGWASVLVAGAVVIAVLAVPTNNAHRIEQCEQNSASAQSADLDLVLAFDVGDSTGLRSLRQSAMIGFVNGMDAQARGAIVDFDEGGPIVKNLTSDKVALVKAIGEIDEGSDSGFASGIRAAIPVDLGAGVRAGLDVLAADADRERNQVMVLVNDGQGRYDKALTAQAAAAGVRIFTVGIGSSVDPSLLASIAEGTSGTYFDAGPDGQSSDAIEATGSVGQDSDHDGLTDCEEMRGARGGDGKLHLTDPDNADTDDDGLTDGQEVTNVLASGEVLGAAVLLGTPLGVEGFRHVVSDPGAEDTDGDGAVDPLEFDVGTHPLVADSDNDGLGDYAEINEHGTDPLQHNTDGDKRDDGWEVDHESSGFDPTVADEETSTLDYASIFALGATCPEGWDRCESDSVAFLAGSIGGGFLAYKDVLDVIGGLTTLDFVAAGVAATALVPMAGDAAGVLSKSTTFLKRVPTQMRLAGLAFIANADKLPVSLRLKIIKAVDDDSFEAVQSQGMTDQAILTAVKKRLDIPLLSRNLNSAKRVEKPSRLYRHEKDAEEDLRARTPGALERQKMFVPPGCTVRCTAGSRYPDVYNPTTKAAFEVKHGKVYASSHVRAEIMKDQALIADPATPITSVTWHFYPNADGALGLSDEVRELLMAAKIPYVMHLP